MKRNDAGWFLRLILGAALLVGCAMALSARGAHAQTCSNCYGDVNHDARITGIDSVYALRIARGIALPAGVVADCAQADVDGDGSVTEDDAQLILDLSVGFIATFPAGPPCRK